MAKKGRPFVYQSEAEKPVTVSLRIPRDVYKQVERYVKMHPGMTLTEFLLDGIRLRLDTPADPRDFILSDDNTVIQKVQEMIQAAVQAEIGTLRDFMQPHVSTPELSHDGNTVLQETEEAAPPDAPEAIEAQIDQHITRLEHRIHEMHSLDGESEDPVPELSHDDNNTVIQEKDAAGQEEGTAPAPATGAPQGRPYGAFMQQVLAVVTHRGALTCEAVAKALDATPKQTNQALKALVHQGKLSKEGTRKTAVYRWCA